MFRIGCKGGHTLDVHCHDFGIVQHHKTEQADSNKSRNKRILNRNVVHAERNVASLRPGLAHCFHAAAEAAAATQWLRRHRTTSTPAADSASMFLDLFTPSKHGCCLYSTVGAPAQTGAHVSPPPPPACRNFPYQACVYRGPPLQSPPVATTVAPTRVGQQRYVFSLYFSSVFAAGAAGAQPAATDCMQIQPILSQVSACCIEFYCQFKLDCSGEVQHDCSMTGLIDRESTPPCLLLAVHVPAASHARCIQVVMIGTGSHFHRHCQRPHPSEEPATLAKVCACSMTAAAG